MKIIAVGHAAMVLAALEAQAAIELVETFPAEKRDRPVKIPRRWGYKYTNSWEDQHPNDDWRGKGNKKRRFK